MKKDKEGVDAIQSVIVFIGLFTLVVLAIVELIKGIVIEHNQMYTLLLGCVFLVVAVDMIYNRTKSGKEANAEMTRLDEQRKKGEEIRKKHEVSRAIYANTYADKPIKLSGGTRAKFDAAFTDAYRKLCGMGAYRIEILKDMTFEEVYTLWFELKTTAPIRIIPNNGGPEIIADIAVSGVSAIIPESVCAALKPYKKPPIEPFSEPKKKTSEAVKKQRKAHAAAENRRKENRIAEEKRREEKRRQPPNFDFYAKEWVNQHMGYVSKMLQCSVVEGEKFVTVKITEDRLPKNKKVWPLIVKKLKEDGVICRYEIYSTGIELKASRK